jgi:hypothetical protein
VKESIDLPAVEATELERVEGGAIGVLPVTPPGYPILVRFKPHPHPLPPAPVPVPYFS